METSGLGFSSSSSALHLRVYTASPNSPSSYFFLLWKGNVHHASFSCPKRQKMSQLVFARVVVAYPCVKASPDFSWGNVIRDYADPSPQSSLMAVSSSESRYLPMRQSGPARSQLALPDVLCCGDRLPCCLLVCLSAWGL